MTDDIPNTEDHKRSELTEAYRKAYKSYILASGLLAAWELIGVTLDTREKWGIELKSPSAAPLILLTLVLYSGYKMEIEWLQCEPGSRAHPAAKLDFVVTHGIALTAIAIAIMQYLWRIQIVEVAGDWVWKNRFELLFVFTMSLTGVLATHASAISDFTYTSGGEKISIVFVFFWLTAMLAASTYFGVRVWMHGIMHFIPSFLLGVCALALLNRTLGRLVTVIRAALFL